MSSITSNTTIKNSNLLSYIFPVTISAGVIVTLDGEINITNNQYFIIGGSNVKINGINNCTININVDNYSGLVQNTNGTYLNIIISNLSIKSQYSINNGAGWICQSSFLNGKVINCNVSGAIGVNCGGIFGQSSSLCTSNNCFTIGTIGQYGGGIFGSYTTNCTATNCYSCGNIGNYGGGIFGFGTNYTYNGDNYSPSSILDQNGDQINILQSPNDFSIVNESNAICCYSNGNIGDYAGGIFGYFTYKSNAENCYSIGSGVGSETAGGIFAYNTYTYNDIIIPSNPICKAENCYTTGNCLGGNGILINSIDQIINCYSEQYNYPNHIIKWRNRHAHKILNNYIWIKFNNNPYLLSSFNNKMYYKTFSEIKHGRQYVHSKEGILDGKYTITNKNLLKHKISVHINCTNGKLSIRKKEKYGTYKIIIVNGYIQSLDNKSFTYINYSICKYICKISK